MFFLNLKKAKNTYSRTLTASAANIDVELLTKTSRANC